MGYNFPSNYTCTLCRTNEGKHNRDRREITTNNYLFTHTSNHLKVSICRQESKRAHQSRFNHTHSFIYNLTCTRDTWPSFKSREKTTRRTQKENKSMEKRKVGYFLFFLTSHSPTGLRKPKFTRECRGKDGDDGQWRCRTMGHAATSLRCADPVGESSPASKICQLQSRVQQLPTNQTAFWAFHTALKTLVPSRFLSLPHTGSLSFLS